MTKTTFTLIQAENGAILKCADGFDEGRPYIMVKEGDVDSTKSPFIDLIGKFVDTFLIDEEWDSDGNNAFEITIDVKRIEE